MKNNKRNVERAKRLARLTEAQAIVAKGVCPTCGTKLHLNLALAGWYQCGHVGAVGFQKEPGAHCDFQIFFDPTPEEHAQILGRRDESQLPLAARKMWA